MGDSAFGFDKPEASPGFLLWQTTITWQRLIKKALDSYHVSHVQFVILAILLWFDETKQESTQVQLVRLSKLDKMTVSASLKILAEKGFIKRVENAKDTRAKLVSLATKGKKMIRQLVPIVEKVDKDFFDVVKKSECDLINILNKLMLSTDNNWS